MKRIIKGALAAIGVAVVLATSACGTVVKTGQDYQAVHYEDGEFSKQTFKDCVGTGERRRDGLGDVDYYYPAGERTFEFDGTDSEPIKIQTKDTQEVSVSGFITFRLTDNCDILRKFHEDKGLKKAAYFTKDGENYNSSGWGDFLKTYFAIPTRAALNSESLKYGWKELYSNTEVQRKFQQDAVKELPTAINNLVGDGVVQIINIQIQPPQPDDALKKTQVDVERNKAAANAEREKALAETASQQAKNDLAKKKFEGSKLCLEVYTQAQCILIDLQNGPNPPQFVPYGTSVIVPGK